MSMLVPKEIHLEYTKGGGSRGFFFKIKQNGGFSLFFLLFGKAPYIPKL